MSRGWESKDVESQQEMKEAERRAASVKRKSAEDLERESLLLTRTRVLHDLERARHPRLKAQVEAALRHLDEKLKTLGS